MNKVLGLLLVFCLNAGLGLPATGQSMRSSAPRARLIASTITSEKSQRGRLLYSTWKGERLDRSHPPVEWPRALEVPGISSFSIRIPTGQMPFNTQVRAWKRIGPNGKPKGKPEVKECGPPTTVPPGTTCRVLPVITPSGTRWEVQFDLARSVGPYYIASSAAWPNQGQVAWLNHLKLAD